jgi:20S proteasome subunit beta 4
MKGLHSLTAFSALTYNHSYHDPEASLEEGLATLKRCIDEVAKRLVVSPGRYKVKVVDKDGVREVEL